VKRFEVEDPLGGLVVAVSLVVEVVVAVGRAEKNSEKSMFKRRGWVLGGSTLCSSVRMG